MNILLDAYFDNNFGDDIFIDVITGMFPMHKFYSFLEFYPESVCERAAKIKNLYPLPECGVFLKKNLFDVYLCVGGDIFPDGGDFSQRKEYACSVKETGGITAFLGFSLFHHYGEKTVRDLRELMEHADIVAPRDEKSAQILRDILPGRKIQSMADLAFAFPWPDKNTVRPGCVGISVRRPNSADDDSMEQYCSAMADAIEHYIKAGEANCVKLFGLSDGIFADKETIDEILRKISGKEKTEVVIYKGNIRETVQELSECRAVICTRLHAMIACICMDIPFLPVIYEVKQEHLLDEIGYTGPRLQFGQLAEAGKTMAQYLQESHSSAAGWDKEQKDRYLQKSISVLDRLRGLLVSPDWADIVCRKDTGGPVCPEKEYGRKQAEAVAQKNLELEKMARDAQKQQEALEENQQVIHQYLATIEECNRENTEYLATIEKCNKENARYIGMIEELSQKNSAQEKLLDSLRPYFTSRTGQKMLQLTNRMLKKKNPDVEANWEEIAKYLGISLIPEEH